jgi:hypothetical protein
VPALGASSRPIRCSSVLLPHPDGPMIEMNSPCRTVRSMPDSATVSMRSVRYTFSMPCIVIVAGADDRLAAAACVPGSYVMTVMNAFASI